MKKLENLGKKLSREETKKVQGGGPRYLYWCVNELGCFCAEEVCPYLCSGQCTVTLEGQYTCNTICGSW